MYEQQIDAGIKLLDRQAPGWRAQVDLDRLDMRYTHTCVIGQLVRGRGSYYAYLHQLGIDGDEAQYGFDIPHLTWEDVTEEYVIDQWRVLTQEWRDAISSGAGT